MHISSEMTNLTRMHHFQNRIYFSGTLFHSDFKNHSPGLQNIDFCICFSYDVQNYKKNQNPQKQAESISCFTASSKIIVPASKTINFVKMLIFEVSQKLFHVHTVHEINHNVFYYLIYTNPLGLPNFPVLLGATWSH